MPYNRYRAQLRFETIPNWDKKDILNLCLTANQADDFSKDLLEDAKDLYYKGALSICEGVNAIGRNLPSWAMVKLYYSVFYFLRATLATQKIALLRGRGWYYIKTSIGEKLRKSKEHTTHKNTISVAIKELKTHDTLMDNMIDGKISYTWLMEKRERIHYREREFHDPGYPDFLEVISQDNLDYLISLYIDDSQFIYCFQEEHACLALPLKRWILTKSDLMKSGINVNFSQERIVLLKKLLNINGNQLSKSINLLQ